jgi:hypothetical protein
LTATSFGDTVGTVGVEVSGGGEVFVGMGVCVGVPVGSDSVGDSVTTVVGVSVTDTLDGRLQASMAKTSASVANKLREFILSPLLLHLSMIMIPLETYPLDSRCLRKVPGIPPGILNKNRRPDVCPMCFDYFNMGILIP